MGEDNDEDDDEVFSALQTIAKKPVIKVDRSILKRKSPDGDGTPRRTRLEFFPTSTPLVTFQTMPITELTAKIANASEEKQGPASDAKTLKVCD